MLGLQQEQDRGVRIFRMRLDKVNALDIKFY